MKVYVHYEEGSDAELHVTLKLTLPKKWNDESPVKLLKVKIPPRQATRTPFATAVAATAAVWERAAEGERYRDHEQQRKPAGKQRVLVLH